MLVYLNITLLTLHDALPIFAHFRAAYAGDTTITKEAIFYYCYGILHHPEYLEKYSDNLSKELPRIPRVKRHEDFWTRSEEHTSELQSHSDLVCRLLLENKIT